MAIVGEKEAKQSQKEINRETKGRKYKDKHIKEIGVFNEKRTLGGGIVVYRVRVLLRESKTEGKWKREPLVDIREHLHSLRFEGFTPRGILLRTVKDIDKLISHLEIARDILEKKQKEIENGT